MQQPRVERRLAAILVADVAGYSRLMGADEVGTLRALKAHRKALIDPLLAAHHGRIFKTMGDALLVEFASAVDAVACAVAIQRGMLARNVDLSADRRIELRAGINVGDVIVEGTDLYGDGVNVAARLETLAEPGGISISATAHEQVRDKLPFAFTDRGEQTVKNISHPVRVYAFGAASVAALAEERTPHETTQRSRAEGRRLRWFWPAAAGLAVVLALALGIWFAVKPAKDPQQSGAAPRFSMVVLPFSNLSGDPTQDYLGDVITEELTTSLSRIPQSFVIARSTAFTYKGKPVDVKQLGKDLGVRYVLEGSEQQVGNRVRVSAQLIDAETGAHLWADQFDADRSDLLQMQDEIVTRLSRTLEIELATVDVARATRARSENLDAEDLTERCEVDLSNAQAEPSKEQAAFSLCERALRIDGRNANALALMAFKYAIPVIQSQSTSPQADIRQADEFVSRALAIDRDSYLAHAAKAYVLLAQKRTEEAIVEGERSLALNPSFMQAYFVLCEANNFLGRPDQALELADKAIRLSPRDPFLFVFFHDKGWALFMKGQYDQAIEWLRRAAAITPLNFAILMLSSALALTGHQTEAQEMLKRYLSLGGVSSTTIAQLRAQQLSLADNPVWVDYNERLFEGLRKAGMPEQ